jgi:hypothetical protein
MSEASDVDVVSDVSNVVEEPELNGAESNLQPDHQVSQVSAFAIFQ